MRGFDCFAVTKRRVFLVPIGHRFQRGVFGDVKRRTCKRVKAFKHQFDCLARDLNGNENEILPCDTDGDHNNHSRCILDCHKLSISPMAGCRDRNTRRQRDMDLPRLRSHDEISHSKFGAWAMDVKG